ncbi:hypothetical protein N802_13330 [Knoellia sinensis KCTC 19936]|uniref:LysM domain-containing protein n=1 Tax=Knoellia sinensis KCTC 19936 TaxID=1385520 RepID=A0A0A0JAI2_9MICO|nr:hypothetical protein [Knoellia sinensis]KGN34435.1 hypothetical protein N802_13330 [Knoellia sinensis KCTC 19936]
MQHIIRGTAAATLALLLAGAGAGAASAVSYPGPYIPKPYVPAVQQGDSLKRIDTQLVRRDNLTGAGASAPSFIPALGS